MTRDEHMAWAKRRALEYLEPGEFQSAQTAVTSIMSDLRKHDETAHLLMPLAATALDATRSLDSARRFIEGFA